MLAKWKPSPGWAASSKGWGMSRKQQNKRFYLPRPEEQTSGRDLADPNPFSFNMVLCSITKGKKAPGSSQEPKASVNMEKVCGKELHAHHAVFPTG